MKTLIIINIILFFSLISNSYSSESYICKPTQNNTGDIYNNEVDLFIIRDKYTFNDVEYKLEEDDFSKYKTNKNITKKYRDLLPDFWLKQVNDLEDAEIFLSLLYTKPSENKNFKILAELNIFYEKELMSVLSFHCN